MIKAIIAVCIAINSVCLACCFKSAGQAERYMEQVTLRKENEK